MGRFHVDGQPPGVTGGHERISLVFELPSATGGWEAWDVMHGIASVARVFDEPCRMILLHKFGLEQVRERFPLGVISGTTPSSLAKARRELEQVCNLDPIEILCDVSGQPADTFLVPLSRV